MGKMQKRIEAHSNGREIVKLSFTVFPETETRKPTIPPDVVRRVTFFSPSVYSVDQPDACLLSTSSSVHDSMTKVTARSPSQTQSTTHHPWSLFQGTLPVGAYIFPSQTQPAPFIMPVVYVPAPVLVPQQQQQQPAVSSQSNIYQSDLCVSAPSLPTATDTPSLSELHSYHASSKTGPEQDTVQSSTTFDQEQHKNDSVNGERKYFCPYAGCNKAFTRSNHVDRHINSVHTKAEGFSCPFCRKQFTREDHFDRHLSIHKKQSKGMKHTMDVEKLKQVLRKHSEQGSSPREDDKRKEADSVLDSKADILHSTSNNTSQVVSTIEKLLQTAMELVKQRENLKDN